MGLRGATGSDPPQTKQLLGPQGREDKVRNAPSRCCRPPPPPPQFHRKTPVQPSLNALGHLLPTHPCIVLIIWPISRHLLQEVFLLPLYPPRPARCPLFGLPSLYSFPLVRPRLHLIIILGGPICFSSFVFKRDPGQSRGMCPSQSSSAWALREHSVTD